MDQNKYAGFVVGKKQVIRDRQSGRPLSKTINGRDYATVLLSQNINFGGLEDVDGNPIFELPKGAVASILVPYKSVQNHRYNDKESYISVPRDYMFKVSIDLGETGNLLPNNKKEHKWTAIPNVTVTQLKDFYSQNKFVTFTISNKQRGANYQTSDGTDRTTILIPKTAGEYAGCRFSCSPHLITSIDGHPNISKVSLPPNALFAIQKSTILGENPQDHSPVFGEKQIVGRLKGSELSELFKLKQEPEQELTVNQVKDEAAESDEDMGMEQ